MRVMKVEEAIKKAIEGGWNSDDPILSRVSLEGFASTLANQDSLFLDSSFWKSLGKALGWGQTIVLKTGIEIKHGEGEWIYKWHEFIDHLADGITAEQFFESLQN